MPAAEHSGERARQLIGRVLSAAIIAAGLVWFVLRVASPGA